MKLLRENDSDFEPGEFDDRDEFDGSENNENEDEDDLLKEAEMRDLRHGIQRIIINLRILNNLNQSDLAKILGTTQGAISRIESGEKIPTTNFFMKISLSLDYKLEINLISKTTGVILNSEGLIIRPEKSSL